MKENKLDIIRRCKKTLLQMAQLAIERSEETSYTPTFEDLQYELLAIADAMQEKEKITGLYTILSNYIGLDIKQLYQKSLSNKPRQTGTIQTRELTKSTRSAATTKEWIKNVNLYTSNMKKQLSKDLNHMLSRSAEIGVTPSKEQTLVYADGLMRRYLQTSDLSTAEQDYVANYTQPWIEKQGAAMYTESLKAVPREVNNQLPDKNENQGKGEDDFNTVDSDEATDKEENNKIGGGIFTISPTRSSSSSKKYSKKKKRSVATAYSEKYTTFSGHDMVCTFELAQTYGPTITSVIGSVQTLTYSIHDEKYPVRVLGNMNAKTYVFGPRTVAGTLIFTVFNRHWAHDLMLKYEKMYQVNAHYLIDELPPLNITLSCANEYGQTGRLALYGVTFVNEGQVMSINDNYTENTYQFFAIDVDYLNDDHWAKRTSPKKKTYPWLTKGENVTYKKNTVNSDSSAANSSSSSDSANAGEEEDSTDSKEHASSHKYFIILWAEAEKYVKDTGYLPDEIVSKINIDKITQLEKERNSIIDQYNRHVITEADQTAALEQLNEDYRKLSDYVITNRKKEEA